MKTYTLTQTRNQHGEVFDKAQIEPILVTKQKRPTHVIISAEAYQKLIIRLEELEDLNYSYAAETALTKSSMVGSEEFTTTLEQIANGLLKGLNSGKPLEISQEWWENKRQELINKLDKA